MFKRTRDHGEFMRSRLEVADSGCWLWLSALDRDGYGDTGGRGLRPERMAHRLAYHIWVEPIPDAMTVDHLCFVRNCVNPRHLRLLSHAENARNQRKSRAYRKAAPPAA